MVLDIVEVARYVTSASRVSPVILDVACPTAYRAHAKATANNRNVCLVLSPSHEIKVFAQGVEVFSFRNARWHLLDVQAKYEMWERAVEDEALASRLFQTALDLSDNRQGALFVVLRDAAQSLPMLVAPGDRLDAPRVKGERRPDRAAAPTCAVESASTWTRRSAGLAKTVARSSWTQRPPAGGRRHLDAHRAGRAALHPRRRRRPHHGRHGRRALRRGPQGQ
jgi:hypothetical protein